jgi:hypothetical protein
LYKRKIASRTKKKKKSPTKYFKKRFFHRTRKGKRTIPFLFSSELASIEVYIFMLLELHQESNGDGQTLPK